MSYSKKSILPYNKNDGTEKRACNPVRGALAGLNDGGSDIADEVHIVINISFYCTYLISQMQVICGCMKQKQTFKLFLANQHGTTSCFWTTSSLKSFKENSTESVVPVSEQCLPSSVHQYDRKDRSS